MVTQSDLERERYEARLKLERDHRMFVKLADRALVQGRQEGLQEGRAIGELLGRIHAFQELLGHPLTPLEDLVALSAEELNRRADELKQQLSR